MVAAYAAMISGQEGGPKSTSSSEALSIRRWGSTPPQGQVVCPRPSGGSQRLDLILGREFSSKLLLELSGNALSSPASGGGEAPVLDCFFILLAGVFSVKKTLSSNLMFPRAIDNIGPFCNLYLPRELHQGLDPCCVFKKGNHHTY
jgi:hypothetical protein